MAERRMFAKTIIDSDAFLDMPISARLLYYDLGMRADDDGFVNSPKKIMKVIGATNDDMNILILRKFIIPFDNGVVVIKHWRINNYLRKDRYTETQYVEQKALLDVDDKGKYHLQKDDGIPHGIPVVATGKDRLGKDRLNNIDSKESICQAEPVEIRQSDKDLVLSYWNGLQNYGIAPVTRIGDGTNRAKMLRARIREYGIDEVLKAIENIRRSDFLKGNNNKGWIITFDWFVKPNNFLKVHDGNYTNRNDAQTMTAQQNKSNGRQG